MIVAVHCSRTGRECGWICDLGLQGGEDGGACQGRRDVWEAVEEGVVGRRFRAG